MGERVTGVSVIWEMREPTKVWINTTLVENQQSHEHYLVQAFLTSWACIVDRVVVRSRSQIAQPDAFFVVFLGMKQDYGCVKKIDHELMREFGPENFDFPIVGSKIKVVVESSVTYQNLLAENSKFKPRSGTWQFVHLFCLLPGRRSPRLTVTLRGSWRGG